MEYLYDNDKLEALLYDFGYMNESSINYRLEKLGFKDIDKLTANQLVCFLDEVKNKCDFNCHIEIGSTYDATPIYELVLENSYR